MIPTPGHTRGHVSIALITDMNRLYLFGGDVAYTNKRLLSQTFSATIKNQKENKESCRKILELSKKMEVVFLPTHDIHSFQRLIHDVKITV